MNRRTKDAAIAKSQIAENELRDAMESVRRARTAIRKIGSTELADVVNYAVEGLLDADRKIDDAILDIEDLVTAAQTDGTGRTYGAGRRAR